MSGRFDFITSEEFRSSLEQDYQEMEKCFGVEAWKSVQILAGSIVEALLVDYLAARPPKESTKDPLKMNLDEAIKACQAEKVLSDRTSGLCGVIRSYRNLIHPGRQIRYDEPPPSKQSASIAMALVDMIVEDIVKVRKGAFGFTAEQLLDKIEHNKNSIVLLPHLLKETHETEMERLLLTVLPQHCLLLMGGHDVFADEYEGAKRIERAFRFLFESASEQLKQ